MLEIDIIKKDLQDTKRRLEKKGFKDFKTLDAAIALDEQRVKYQKKFDDLKFSYNTRSKKIGDLEQKLRKLKAEIGNLITLPDENLEKRLQELKMEYLNESDFSKMTTFEEFLEIKKEDPSAFTRINSQMLDAITIKKFENLVIASKELNAEAKKVLTETEENLEEFIERLEEDLLAIPNLPHESVPEGKLPEHNVTVFRYEKQVDLPNNALCHWDLASKYKIIDLELGVKITGAGFPVYIGKGAKLQRALINYFLDKAIDAGYTEVQPPILVNAASAKGTGQLPDKEGQMYHVGVDDLYLIPTAEVPITNIYRKVTLKESELPIKNCGYTPCFRREAGSYGKDVRGLNRLHQFDKVEIVQIAHPDKSYATLEDMREFVAGILKELELPFRTLKLCGGDMSFASALTYDMEVWSAAQKRWLEVSSVSNFETFQANRLKCRFKGADGKTNLCHTLNGSALALPRIVASLLENNQTETGIKIPAVLVKYCGFDLIN